MGGIHLHRFLGRDAEEGCVELFHRTLQKAATTGVDQTVVFIEHGASIVDVPTERARVSYVRELHRGAKASNLNR